MDEFDKDQTLQWYEWLEGQLLEIMKYIPPSKENLRNYSPRLASLVVDACGLLDSILRQISVDPSMIDGKKKPRKDLNIIDYANLYARKFELPSFKSILLVSPPSYLCPFEVWAKEPYRAPSWWKTHTDLKHDWIANFRNGTLDAAIESLCGLQQIIAFTPDLGGMVLRRGWVPGKQAGPEMVLRTLTGQSDLGPILVETKLFVVCRGPQKFPEYIDQFKPAQFDASERLIDFFGRW